MKQQYSKRMVIIHWLTLLLLLVTWYLGDMLETDRLAKSSTLIGHVAHMAAGISVLFLTILRLTFRGVDGTPPLVSQSLMDIVAKGVHMFIYALLMALPASGMIVAMTSSVGWALLAGDASMLPVEYTGPGVVTRAAHDFLFTVLLVVLAVHILGALKHQFILKDNLLKRMTLPKKG